MRKIEFADGFETNEAPIVLGTPATDIEVTPAGNLSATDVQAALEEIQIDVDGLNTAVGQKASQTDLDTLTTTVSGKAEQSSLTTHINDVANPHGVTKSQVGLPNVSNDAQLKIASNLSDLASATTARTNLGLGTAAVLDNASANFNANKFQGISVSATTPLATQVMAYDGVVWKATDSATSPVLPRLFASTTAGQAHAANTESIIVFGTVGFNTTGLTYNSTTGVATVDVAGDYIVILNATYANLGAHGGIFTRGIKHNTTIAAKKAWHLWTGASQTYRMDGSVAVMIRCAVNDTIHCYIHHTAGANYALSTEVGQCNLSIARVG